MGNPLLKSLTIRDSELGAKLREGRLPYSFELELTARCNLDCRHCYVNRPADDRAAAAAELSAEEILGLGRQAVDLGALWCTLTGGEPLLRPDFEEIYLGLKRLGLLVSVYTNATIINDQHIALFRAYPPRDLEVTVYGVTAATYESVTRRPGSYGRFRAGLDRLLDAGLKVRLKAMALRSTLAEMEDIARFCRARTKDYFRFDPLLHLRTDRNPARNAEILSERLTPSEIARLERDDPERFPALEKKCDRLVEPRREEQDYDECLACAEKDGCERFDQMTRLFGCGTGVGGFYIAYDSSYRLCASLCAPGMTYDLRKGTLKDAWETFTPRVRALRTTKDTLPRSCKTCPIVNLCMNCPAHADLESGDPESVVAYFCDVARARRDNLVLAKAKAEALKTKRHDAPSGSSQ